ncbi:hypothetical protein AB3Y40_07520 [Yoonia sp. R2331]|uniref:hypothetical protein n=1 Tax=Yoonia sp. R2331 TaxID=3237238 RepID=UPI0034E431DE
MPRRALSHRLADLLISPAVQTINFRLGHVHVFPSHFRAVSDALRDGRVAVNFEPARLTAEGSDAEYDSGANAFAFASDGVLDTALGRATAIHEASHAGADFLKKGTAIRQEEGAAFICEAWYLLNTGVDPASSDVPANTIAAARAMRDRCLPSVPVNASANEINTVRRDMANRGYENAFYGNDGF